MEEETNNDTEYHLIDDEGGFWIDFECEDRSKE
jgi:hypothetical protein